MFKFLDSRSYLECMMKRETGQDRLRPMSRRLSISIMQWTCIEIKAKVGPRLVLMT